MSSIDKQARQVSRYDLVSGYMQKWPDGDFVYQSDYQELLDKLEAKDKRIAEQADVIAKQEKWIKDVEATMISATDRAEAAEKRIAEQRGIILSARNFISEYAERGDVGAEEFVSIIDRAAGTAKGE